MYNGNRWWGINATKNDYEQELRFYDLNGNTDEKKTKPLLDPVDIFLSLAKECQADDEEYRAHLI
ncbi:hypothetical protein [Bacillus spizizenii]|uniref:hypothetical protein n=1 Tax=Bacillus spizizenii TaxID=96241 RepID=UPI0005A274E0|nr:hypothetical protein [Bacillus spizizenii]APH67429.1 hypothetical protein BAX60_08485 [Bacillus subtilis]MEC1529281.1 hypothetical protein [Bacillus spizizenii]GEK27166.1 hypothetical protein BSU04nite_35550 [Bacillus spizizenii]